MLAVQGEDALMGGQGKEIGESDLVNICTRAEQ